MHYNPLLTAHMALGRHNIARKRKRAGSSFLELLDLDASTQLSGVPARAI